MAAAADIQSNSPELCYATTSHLCIAGPATSQKILAFHGKCANSNHLNNLDISV